MGTREGDQEIEGANFTRLTISSAWTWPPGRSRAATYI